MAVLLDTHAFLWWVSDDVRLTARARRAIARNDCRLSLASCWEMAIKVGLRKLQLPTGVDRFVQQQLVLNGFTLLPVALEHVAAVAELRFHHRDPFDRLLAPQASIEELRIVSSDDTFTKYGVKRIW